VKLEDRTRNVELTEGGQEIYDETYRRRYRVDESSVQSGVFMRELAPAEVIAHLASNQAVALSVQGRLDEALARYDRALKLSPRLVVAWYNRGLDLMNAGRLREAVASFTRAIELHPWDAQAHNNRGLALLKLGNRDAARADFQRALELEPGMKEAEENLGRLAASAPLSH
jgi:tetratricopeptide (TPR) repeat protein